MVNADIVKLIQDTADSFTQSTSVNYKAIYSGYSCIVFNEYTYEFKKDTPKVINAIVKFGSAQKNNDLEDKFTMNFVVNIFSEPNGWVKAKSLFDDVFLTLTRTYQTLGNYKAKIFFSSPALMNEKVEVGSNFYSYLTMNGSIEFSKNVVLGATYQLSLDGANYVDIKPRQPYCMKECVGGNDNNYNTPSIMTFSKQSNVLTIQLTILYEQIVKNVLTSAETRFNALFNKLLDECYGASSQEYYYKETTGTVVKSLSDLICVRGQKIYDETTGENVLSIQLKVGA